MKELQEEFIGRGQVKGFRFTQMNKTEYGYIYSVNTGDRIAFEVFKRNENNYHNCVSYPSNKAFGKWAWTCGTYERALDIFSDIETAYLTNKNK